MSNSAESWFEDRGTGGRRFVDISLKPPLKLRWKVKLKLPHSGIAHAGRVVIVCDGGIHAFDLKTGKEAWCFEEYGKKSYSSVRPTGNDESVFFHARREFLALSWKDGKLIWKQKRSRNIANTPDRPKYCGNDALILDNELINTSNGTCTRKLGLFVRACVSERLICASKDEKAILCVDLNEKEMWKLKHNKDRFRIEMANERFLLVLNGPYDNQYRYIYDITTGKLLGKSPYMLLPKSWELVEDWIGAALDENVLIVRATRDERGGILKGGYQGGIDNDYYSRAEAYLLPECRRLWQGEHVFHQSGHHAHCGSPDNWVLSRDHIWYSWRTYTSANPKSYLTALNRSDGKVSFQCVVGPWAEHMLAFEDVLIYIGRGGTVFCYESK